MDADITVEDPTLREFFLYDEDLRFQLYEEELERGPIVKQCVLGTAESVYQQLAQLVLIVLLSRLAKILRIPTVVKDSFSISLGVYAIRINVSDDELFSTVLIVVLSLSVFSKLLRGSSKGLVVTVLGILTIVMLELLIEEVSVVRGILMIFVMKLSSLSFDYSSQNSPGFLPTLSYLLDPSTVIFGPFISFRDCQEATKHASITVSILFTPRTLQQKEVWSLFRATLCILASLVCVVYSSCHSELFDIPAYLSDFFTAQSFRFSHYFICLFSQGLWSISGGSGPVANPLPIELPRSLVDVVIAWNVPMHRYLRIYVFRAARGWGSGLAVFLTFLVSSLLHGLNFQLSAVLVSLGFLCYGENALRNRLSSRLSACIRTRPCESCNHIRKNTSPAVFLTNLLFTALSVYHLVYLGMSFDGLSSAGHVLSTWSRHFFASHIFALFYILLSRIL